MILIKHLCLLFALAFNAKRFVTAIPYFLLLIPRAVYGWTGKRLWPVFNVLLLKTRVTSIGHVSLETLVNFFVLDLFAVISGVGGQYLFNTDVEFFGNCFACLICSKRASLLETSA